VGVSVVLYLKRYADFNLCAASTVTVDCTSERDSGRVPLWACAAAVVTN